MEYIKSNKNTMSIRMTRKMKLKQGLLKKEHRRRMLLKNYPDTITLKKCYGENLDELNYLAKLEAAHKITKPNPLPGELDESYPGQVSQQEFYHE